MEIPLAQDLARKYLDIAGVAIVVINADQRVGLINKMGCQILGYTQGEIVGQNWFEKFLPERTRAEVLNIFNSLMSGDKKTYRTVEGVVLSKSGEEKIIAWNNTVLTDEQGKIIGTLSSGMDITSQKQAQEKLRKTEAAYRSLVEQIPAVVYMDAIDEVSSSLYMSPQIQQLVGYSSEDWLTDRDMWVTLIHAEDYDRVIAENLRTNATGDPFRMEYRMMHRDGRVVWVRDEAVMVRDESGKPLFWRGVLVDITQRKQMEVALQESEQRLKTMIEQQGEGFAVVDLKETFIFANPAAEMIFGSSAGELVGRNLREFTNVEQFATIRSQTKFHKRGGKSTYEVDIIRPDGEIRNLIITATADFDHDGKFKGTFGTFRDNTERRRIEEALRESESRYRNIFESASIAIMEEDFLAVISMINDIKAQGVSDFREYLDDHPDFVQVAAGQIRIIDVNRTTLKMFGAKNKSQLIGNLDKIFIPETLNIFRQEIIAIAEGNTYFEGETINHNLRGEPLNIWLTMTIPTETDQFHSVLVSLVDITDRKRVENEITMQRVRFQQLFENAPIAIALLDPQDRLQAVNPAFKSLFQYEKDDITGRYINDLVVPNHLTEQASTISSSALGWKPINLETIRRRKDGSLFPVHIHGVPIHIEGKTVGVYAMYEDISERKQEAEKLEYISSHDALTGLYNRAYFESEMVRFDKEGLFPVSIVAADLDGLKKINDTLGHAAGDRLLSASAELFKKAFRAIDVVARVGGDEFAVLLPRTNHADAQRILTRIKSYLSDHNKSNPEHPISFSIGFALGEPGCVLAQVLQEADRNMYLDKATKASHSFPK